MQRLCQFSCPQREEEVAHLPFGCTWPWQTAQRLPWACSISCCLSGLLRQVGSVSLSLLDLPVVPLPSRGNLFTRTLSDIVSKEDFVLDSEYLTTLLVIVPKYVGRKIMGVCCSGENEVGPLCPAGSGQQTLLLGARGGVTISTGTEPGGW